MTLFAHALIEVGDTKYKRGDLVPEDLPGLDELIEGGAVSPETYNPASDEVGPPDVVEIDGVTYVQAEDSAGGDDVVEVS
jgi:hypothetical protein